MFLFFMKGMVSLKQIGPTKSFENYWPHVKMYPGSMGDEILSLLENESLNNLQINQINTQTNHTQQIILVRHLESKYNEYKKTIKEDPRYKNFLQETDDSIKKELALLLLEDFRQNVGVDYTTDISKQGHEQWEMFWKLYADFIRQNPSFFPSLIVVSPYLRTRLTAHYFLKYVEGLDVDFDALVHKDSSRLRDMIIGSFHGNEVIIQLRDEVRERDHGSDVAPSYLRKYIDSLDPFRRTTELSDDELWQIHYYTAPSGGEAQVAVNARIKNYLYSLTSGSDYHKSIMIFTHHLAILWALNTIYKWSINTFQDLDKYWKPSNGSLTVLSKLQETETGQRDKLRVSWYNMLFKK